MFEGTIRENIDPAGEYEDHNIWIALEQVSYYSSINEQCLYQYIDFALGSP